MIATVFAQRIFDEEIATERLLRSRIDFRRWSSSIVKKY